MGLRHKVPLRLRHGILVKRCGEVPLRCLGNVPMRRRWVFHLRRTGDFARTYRDDVLMPGA